MRPDSYVSGSRPWEDVVFIQDPVEVSPNHQMPARIPSKGGFEGCAENSPVCCLTRTWDVEVDQRTRRIKDGGSQAQQTALACISICPGILLPATCIATQCQCSYCKGSTSSVSVVLYKVCDQYPSWSAVQDGHNELVEEAKMKTETSDNRYFSSPDNTTDALRCNAHVSFC